MTWLAPRSAAPATPISPTGPSPRTATVSPKSISIRCTAVKAVATMSGTIRAWRSVIPSGIGVMVMSTSIARTSSAKTPATVGSSEK